jgi:hypothetical protein
MSTLKAVTKTSLENKLYVVDYTCWLTDPETIFDHAVAVSPATDPPLDVNPGTATDPLRQIALFVGAGVPSTIYLIRIIATTSTGQIKEDDIQMAVT